MKSHIQEEQATKKPQAYDRAAVTQLDTLLSSKKYLAVTIPVDGDVQGADEAALDEMRNYQFGSGRSKDAIKFDEFKNIERNIKREILDYSSTEESPSMVMNDSRSDEGNGETLSLEGDDASPVEIPGDYKALMDGAAEFKVFSARGSEKTIGDQIMDRKRLRVF